MKGTEPQSADPEIRIATIRAIRSSFKVGARTRHSSSLAKSLQRYCAFVTISATAREMMPAQLPLA
jgi:hypothetical protein